MNGLNENSYTDLIYRFMDGDTSSIEQSVLFGALANNSELQMEFQQAVSIVKGFSADKVALTPPPSLTNNIFISAGFNPPMPLDKVAPVGLISRLKQFTTPVISAATGALLTVAIFFAINSDKNELVQNNSYKQNLNETTEQTQASISSLPIVKVSESRDVKSSPIENINVKNDNLVPDNPICEVFGRNDRSNFVSNFNTIPRASSQMNLFNNDGAEKFSLPEFNYLNLELEVRGMTGLAFLPSRTIQPEPWAIMNNIGIGIKYKFNETHSTGIVAGKESLQMYSFNQSGDGYKYQYEPNLAWIGACYRWTGEEFYGAVSPYCELTAAYSKFGPVGKTALGIAYNPENIISMSVGVECTALAYKFLGDIRTTEKISLVYNIGIHF